MTQRIRQCAIAAILAGLAVVLAWPTRRVTAFNTQPDPAAFGLIGIGPNDTLRMNAICPDTALPGDVPPGPCDVAMVVRDMSGRVLKRGATTLVPGQGTSLDFTGAEIGAAGRRLELQPFYAPAGRGFILATVEVIDSSGHTAVVLNPTQPKSQASTAGQ